MDSSSDMSFSVFCSPDGSTEPPKSEKIKTSVSVSSLAEKFEKGGDSIKCENGLVNGSAEVNGNATEVSVEAGDCNPCVQEDKKHNTQSSESANKIDETDRSECKETGEKTESCPQNSKGDVISGAGELKSKSHSSDAQSCTFNDEQFQDICKAVEERVAYFVEKITKSSEAEKSAPKGDVTRHLSSKDLQKSFLNALNLVNENEADKAADTLSVPSIEITAASDKEDTSSEDAEETKQESGNNETENKTSVEKMDVSDADANENIEPTLSTSSANQSKKTDKSEVSAEESRAYFYISSADLPAGLINDTLESSDELNERPTNQQAQSENVRASLPGTRTTSCLCSKNVHGVIFLFSFIVAILGFILYGLANEGKVPHFCQHVGLVTAVIAGTIGAFSCFCFTFLEAFPRLVIPGYEGLFNSENVQSSNRNRNAQAQNLDDESWSSETERAFRIQNGMPSTRTSAGSLERTTSDHREQIQQIEKLKKEVVGLLDSFSELLTKLEKSGEVSDVESGVANKHN